MIFLIGPLLLVVLGFAAIKLKKAGLTSGEIVVFVILRVIAIVGVMFGIFGMGIFRVRLKRSCATSTV